ncbi:MAG TPA: hypothetical protein VFR63_07565 [Gaiellaceae bacterium]|nr:hypothetical protein [Gaiellaceae bacterium]
MLLLAAVALVVTLVVAPVASAWTVTMDANPTFKRTHHWAIEKSVSQSSVTLEPGETANVTYTVTVKSTGFTDSDWGVSGNVHMTAGDDAITVATVGVKIQADDLDALVNCVPPLPFNLGGGALDCSYSASLADGSARTAVMRATTTDGGQRVVQTPFDFSNATMTEIDECVAVTDTQAGSLGTVCVGDAPKTFTYTKTIGPYAECGPRTVDNTATFTTNDTGATGSAGAQVDVDVVCAPPSDGCTRTIGYWKTHAGFGPQADAVTPLLPITLGTAGGAKSITVTTAALAVQLLSNEGSNDVADSSNGINKLYAQLLGAKLNGASGADTSGVAGTIAAADAFLATHDSTDWSGLSDAQKEMVLDWKDTLDDYNNGRSGVEHCD